MADDKEYLEGWYCETPLGDVAREQTWLGACCGDPIEVGNLAPCWFMRNVDGKPTEVKLVAVHRHCLPGVLALQHFTAVQSQVKAQGGAAGYAITALRAVGAFPPRQPVKS